MRTNERIKMITLLLMIEDGSELSHFSRSLNLCHPNLHDWSVQQSHDLIRAIFFLSY